MSSVETPPALSSPSALSKAISTVPSRATVEVWLQAWPALNVKFQSGHALALEDALFQCATDPGKPGFRAVWVLALLAERGVLESSNAPRRLAALLDDTDDLSRQRELLRALLHLDLPHPVLAELLEWACAVVYLQGLPPAQYHMAVRMLDKGMSSSLAFSRQDVQEALAHLRSTDHPGHLKKKAALLRARLS